MFECRKYRAWSYVKDCEVFSNDVWSHLACLAANEGFLIELSVVVCQALPSASSAVNFRPIAITRLPSRSQD